LGRFLAGEPVHARRAGPLERGWKFARRRKGLVALATALVGVLASLALWGSAELRRRGEVREAAVQQARLVEDKRTEKRLTAEHNMEAGLAQLRSGQFETAVRLFGEALNRVSDEPGLADLQSASEACLARARQLAEYYACRDRMELAAAFREDKKAAAACEEGMRVLGIEGRKQWWSELPSEDLTPVQAARLREDVYLQLLELSVIRVSNHVIGHGILSIPDALAIGRKTLEQAEGFRVTYASRVLDLLAKTLSGTAAPADTPLPPPGDHVDYYLRGLLHFWMAEPQHDSLSPLQSVILSTVKLPGMELRNPVDRAESDFRTATALYPQHYWGYLWLGIVLREKKQYRDADLAFTCCIALRPDCPAGFAARSTLARHLTSAPGLTAPEKQALLERGDLDRRRALDAPPNVTGVSSTMIERDLLEQERYAEVAVIARRLSTVDGIRDDQFNLLAVVLFKQGKLAEAVGPLEEAIRLAPDQALYRSNLGRTFLELGRYGDAEAALRRALALGDGGWDIHNDLGNVFYNQGRLAEAVAEHEKASKLKASEPVPHQNLGWDFNASGKAGEAVVAFNKAIALKDDDADCHLGLGQALTALARFGEARAAFSHCHGLLKPGNPVFPKLERAERDCAELASRERELSEFLEDEAAPCDPVRALGLAGLCRLPGRGLYATATRLYDAAFTAAPASAARPQEGDRLRAARAAALASAGQGEDCKRQPDAVRHWQRRRSLLWLRDELADQSSRVRAAPKDKAQEAARTVRLLKELPDLDNVRSPAALGEMPAPERREWEQFWAEVDALLRTEVPTRPAGSATTPGVVAPR
jgi:tetratricopeptide (TPR) repeat protein